jgi:hypothetical protein
MSAYAGLELQTLLDFLVKYTTKYTEMLSLGIYSVEEITQCRESLMELHEAIALKQAQSNEISNLKAI